ncbi:MULTISPECIES: hypothetical protein [Cyanophyceae]|uniref:Uncharacterized protein n=1 Tax=Leptolyngbya subtilissima DQ-A4 TaxID=2933933 RepID=A0ABV0K5B3_9CYAN|nr:hypothetical protein [Nodosilinea sp. FACHB-141]MBD2112907.1 hypothetical protein [Nodosilinea sp. FACHB-141]
MPTPKFLKQAAIALIGFEVGLALTYLALVNRRGEAGLFDFNGLRSLPSWLQAILLGTIGLLCVGVLRSRRHMARPISWVLPSAVALLCFLGAADELLKFHLTLRQVDWKLVYLSLLVAIAVLGFRDLVWLWRTHRPTVLGVLAGLGIFLLGGFGTEMAKDAIAAALPSHSSSATVLLIEHLRITLEELAELLGETIILYAVACFAQQVSHTQAQTFNYP